MNANSEKPARVDLYTNAYAHHIEDVYARVRRETYGEDFGQTSWVTNEESSEIPRLIGVTRNSSVLEIGCGSGAYALHLAKVAGCRIVGLDSNESGVRNATALTVAANLSEQASFECSDASQPLYYPDGSFDCSFLNDVICHIPGRAALLGELGRVLKPRGRLLFSDALVIGGMISHQEIAARSSIGYYVFSAPGENERLLRQTAFSLVEVRDTTANAALIAERWHDARERHRGELIRLEGEINFEGLQRFLDCVYALTSERRLLRYLYLAEKQ